MVSRVTVLCKFYCVSKVVDKQEKIIIRFQHKEDAYKTFEWLNQNCDGVYKYRVITLTGENYLDFYTNEKAYLCSGFEEFLRLQEDPKYREPRKVQEDSLEN